MKKSYEEQNKDIREKEEKKAKAMGFNSVYDYRNYMAIENRKKTYIAKIERYEKVIKEMKEYIENN